MELQRKAAIRRGLYDSRPTRFSVKLGMELAGNKTGKFLCMPILEHLVEPRADTVAVVICRYADIQSGTI